MSNFLHEYDIYILMAFTVICTLSSLFFLAWISWSVGEPARRAKRMAKNRKCFWIVSRYQGDPSGKRIYFGVDFFDAKHRKTGFKIHRFDTAHEAFFATKEFLDDEDYDVELLSYKEFKQRWDGAPDILEGESK